jgi:hypothetical protein
LGQPKTRLADEYGYDVAQPPNNILRDELMSTIRIAIFVAFCTAFPTFAVARDDVIHIIGFDDMSCGAWASSSSEPQRRQVYFFWFRGVMSGFNLGSPRRQVHITAMPSDDTLALYVDKYCREHPLNGFPGAAFDLVKEITVKK